MKINIEHSVGLSLAKLTPGYSAADLEFIFKEISNESYIMSEL